MGEKAKHLHARGVLGHLQIFGRLKNEQKMLFVVLCLPICTLVLNDESFVLNAICTPHYIRNTRFTTPAT